MATITMALAAAVVSSADVSSNEAVIPSKTRELRAEKKGSKVYFIGGGVPYGGFGGKYFEGSKGSKYSRYRVIGGPPAYRPWGPPRRPIYRRPWGPPRRPRYRRPRRWRRRPMWRRPHWR